jgi:hypothetical protein
VRSGERDLVADRVPDRAVASRLGQTIAQDAHCCDDVASDDAMRSGGFGGFALGCLRRGPADLVGS